MKTRTCLLSLVALASFTLLPSAFADLYIRVSVKLIYSAAGNPPANSSGDVTEATVQAMIDKANVWLDDDGRGYQLKLTGVIPVLGLSDWYNVEVDASTRSSLDAEVTASADSMSRYSFARNAINIYINGYSSGTYSGYCAFPPDENVILLRANASALTLLHECGHYFHLYHTHQGEDGCADPSESCGCGETLVGGNADHIGDTIADHRCWSQDNIATGNYGVTYANLNTSQQAAVDRVWYNLMSYHGPPDPVITPDQWDRLTDNANGVRDNVASGKTIFVDNTADCDDLPYGTSTCPYPTVFLGVFLGADAGDIVLLRSGNYVEEPASGETTLVISKAVTLRASRGNATVTIP